MDNELAQLQLQRTKLLGLLSPHRRTIEHELEYSTELENLCNLLCVIEIKILLHTKDTTDIFEQLQHVATIDKHEEAFTSFLCGLHHIIKINDDQSGLIISPPMIPLIHAIVQLGANNYAKLKGMATRSSDN